MAVVTVGFVACSSDDETSDKVEEINSRTSFSYEVTVDDFLRNYYIGENYVIGRTVLTEDEEGKYEIQEVVLNNNPKRIGYVAIQEGTKNVLYFIDKDLDSNTLYTLDVKSNKGDIYTDINKDEDFEFLHKFDFIYIINLRNEFVNNTNNSNMTTFGLGGGGVTIYERRFSIQNIWANDVENCGDPYSMVDENLNVTCWQTCTYTSYRFFFKTKETSMQVPAEGC